MRKRLQVKFFSRMIGVIIVFCMAYSFLTTAEPDEVAGLSSREITIGAIRWDAWYGNSGAMGYIAEQSRKMLSPVEFRHRTPFYATVGEDDLLDIVITQQTMDQEIAYAKNGGIDYFAFQWYGDGWGFDIALDTYLTSAHKNDVKFCYIFYSTLIEYMKPEMSTIMSRIKLSNYQTVVGGRPLVYLMNDTWTADSIKTLRDAAEAAGLPPLYLVFMGWSGSGTSAMSNELGGQAISSYVSVRTGAGSGGKAYSVYKDDEISLWETYMNTSSVFVPFVSTGWGPRPIGKYHESDITAEEKASVESWYPYSLCGPDDWVQTATPAQVADHLKDALNLVNNSQPVDSPNTVIMYAWNEFSEGGYICPVLDGGSERLDAIRKMLNAYEYVAPTAAPTFNPYSRVESSSISSDPSISSNQSSSTSTKSEASSQSSSVSSNQSSSTSTKSEASSQSSSVSSTPMVSSNSTSNASSGLTKSEEIKSGRSESDTGRDTKDTSSNKNDKPGSIFRAIIAVVIVLLTGGGAALYLLISKKRK